MYNDYMCLKVENKSQNSNYFIGLQSRGWLATGLPQECQVAGRLLSQRSQLRQCPGEYTWSKRELNNYTVWKEIKCSVDSEILHQLFRDNTRKLKKHELIRVISCAVSRNPHTTSFSFEQCIHGSFVSSVDGSFVWPGLLLTIYAPITGNIAIYIITLPTKSFPP